jgi:hypothetical protein
MPGVTKTVANLVGYGEGILAAYESGFKAI